jgi:hypothetical protein
MSKEMNLLIEKEEWFVALEIHLNLRTGMIGINPYV